MATHLGLCLQVDMVAGSVPTAALADVLAALAEYMTDCPHLEFLLKWVRSLCLRHGTTLQVCAYTLLHQISIWVAMNYRHHVFGSC